MKVYSKSKKLDMETHERREKFRFRKDTVCVHKIITKYICRLLRIPMARYPLAKNCLDLSRIDTDFHMQSLLDPLDLEQILKDTKPEKSRNKRLI